MKVRLKELRPNPLRDFGVDPLDEEAINRLRASISEHGFWGGVVGRQRNGHIEIGAGHHRVEAAVREGIEEGEVHIVDRMDDRQMVRLYAEENATQRGAANSTARAGSVAAALRQAAYEVLMADGFSGIPEKPSALSTAQLQGNAMSARGIGEPIISDYLEGVPGVTKNTVLQDLASLKKSGEYARIIAEVRDRIVREKQSAEVIERAQKAAKKAAEQEAEFDFKGVASHFRVAHHLQSFRDVVTSPMVKKHLPIDQQAAVAEQVVKLAERTGQELTALYIRGTVIEALTQIKERERRITAAEREELLRADWKKRCSDLQEHYLGALRSVFMYGNRLLEHLDNAPKEEPWPVRSSYEPTLRQALEVIAKVREKL